MVYWIVVCDVLLYMHIITCILYSRALARSTMHATSVQAAVCPHTYCSVTVGLGLDCSVGLYCNNCINATREHLADELTMSSDGRSGELLLSPHLWLTSPRDVTRSDERQGDHSTVTWASSVIGAPWWQNDSDSSSGCNYNTVTVNSGAVCLSVCLVQFEEVREWDRRNKQERVYVALLIHGVALIHCTLILSIYTLVIDC